LIGANEYSTLNIQVKNTVKHTKQGNQDKKKDRVSSWLKHKPIKEQQQ